MDTLKDLKIIDTQNMFDILKNFPIQVRDALNLEEEFPVFKDGLHSNEFIILGMGGSAIGGDLIKTYFNNLDGAKHLSINVNRNYKINSMIKPVTNIIACSYSGDTEETLSGLNQALESTRQVLCITSGGILKTTAKKNNLPLITIPGGYQPRCALALLFFPMLQFFIRSKMLANDATKITNRALFEIQEILTEKSKIYSEFTNGSNPALILAKKLMNSTPVIYSSSDRLDSVNLRWRCQIQENAKYMAFGNLLPEMNHNEINSWSHPEDLMQRFSLLLLVDKADNERVKIRFNALEQLLSDNVKQVIRIESDAEYHLARMFDLIYLGDWVSYYLALLNRVDPTPIPLISRLKSLLAEK